MAKPTKPTSAAGRVALPADRFWELRARIAEASAARGAASRAAADARAAEQRAQALLVALAAEHHFDANTRWQCDDETRSLVPVQAGPLPAQELPDGRTTNE